MHYGIVIIKLFKPRELGKITETEVQGVGIPAILFVQPMIEAFNKSDSNTKGMPLEVNKMSFRSKGNPFRNKWNVFRSKGNPF